MLTQTKIVYSYESVRLNRNIHMKRNFVQWRRHHHQILYSTTFFLFVFCFTNTYKKKTTKFKSSCHICENKKWARVRLIYKIQHFNQNKIDLNAKLKWNKIKNTTRIPISLYSKGLFFSFFFFSTYASAARSHFQRWPTQNIKFIAITHSLTLHVVFFFLVFTYRLIILPRNKKKTEIHHANSINRKWACNFIFKFDSNRFIL